MTRWKRRIRPWHPTTRSRCASRPTIKCSLCRRRPDKGPCLSLRGGGKTAIDDPADFAAAGAAIGSSTRFLADRLDAVASAAHGGGDLVDPDAEAGADGGAGIRPAGAGTACDER